MECIAFEVFKFMLQSPYDIINLVLLVSFYVCTNSPSMETSSVLLGLACFFDLNSFFLFPSTSREIEVEISNLRTSQAVGPFSIPIDILKIIKCVVSKPLEILFNASFSTGIVPYDLQLAMQYLCIKKDHKQAFQTIVLFISYLSLINYWKGLCATQ